MVAIHVSIGVLQITHISRYFQNRNTFARIDPNLISSCGEQTPLLQQICKTT